MEISRFTSVPMIISLAEMDLNIKWVDNYNFAGVHALSPAHLLFYSRPISCFLSQEQIQFSFSFFLRLLAHDVLASL